MFNSVECLESSGKNVWKYIFTKDNAIAEAVLYKYNDFYERTVICCSTMSGCPVGCTFCGTGKKFIKNLSSMEIIQQIEEILLDKNIKDICDKGERFQIMFMSMGEPMLNWNETEEAIRILHDLYPNAELLLSTIGVDNDEVFRKIVELSMEIDKVGLQFSIHKSNDHDRDALIPFKKKMSLKKIRDAGIVWWKKTGRYPYLNYCIDGHNNTKQDVENLTSLFSPVVFNFTFSVVCSADESMKEAGYRNLDIVTDFCNSFSQEGYNTRIFDPAGQDDIGGGCGQLWHVQKWMHDYRKEK
jgi:23S rRNA (adenine2503-C2)-methyltransferase